MNIRSSSAPLPEIDADALVVTLFVAEDGRDPDAQLDGWTGGLLGDLYASGEFSGKTLETALVHRPAGLAARRLLLIGGGKRGEYTHAIARRCAAAALRALKPKGARRVAAVVPEGSDVAQQIAEGLLLGDFEVGVYKDDTQEPRKTIKEALVVSSGDIADAVERGRAIGEGQNYARSLANEPGNLLTPVVLAERARELAAECGLEIDVLERRQLETLRMGALLGVAQGSAEPPVMIVLRYRPEQGAGDVHLGLVGKAVTFDTGGISIKPSPDMDRMKYDMAGGAAVLGAMKAIAALKPGVEVTAVVPSVENMPGSRAMRPGDVVTAMSGKTIEVLNTDAEGRLILADALSYAQQLGCNRLIDAATLTGAIVVALGYERAAVFANDASWLAMVQSAAEQAGEKLWPMPLDDEYRELIDSGIADLQNIGPRWGGAITAAMFLKQFGDPAPWAHLDIAGTAWLEADKPEMPKGPTGMGARLFVELAERLAAG